MAKSVRDTMTGEPRSIATPDSAVEAARLMRDEDVGSLPVTEEGNLVGMITDRDTAIRVVAESETSARATRSLRRRTRTWTRRCD
jgi:predicted transcriptional regulator